MKDFTEDKEQAPNWSPDDKLHLYVAREFQRHTKTYGFFADFVNKLNQRTGTVSDILIGDPGELYQSNPKPAFTMEHDQVQAFFQELWDMGFRPSSEEGNIGALKATQGHLEDMRKIAFDQLDRQKTFYVVGGNNEQGNIQEFNS